MDWLIEQKEFWYGVLIAGTFAWVCWYRPKPPQLEQETFQTPESQLRKEWNPILVLSRKQGESIVIGDGIVVTVVEIDGGKVRLGVAADRNVPVHRQEVYERIQESANGTAEPASSPR